MVVSVKHAFASAKADSGDPTLIQPSNWNAEHAVTLAAGKVLGRDASGAGTMQELPLAFDATGQSMVPPSGTIAQRPATPVAGMTRYNTDTGRGEMYIGGLWVAILTALEQEPTGKIAHFLLASAPSGWVVALGGTIGDGSSGGSTRANSDTFALFGALWALDPTVSPMTTSIGGATARGGSAAADFAAHNRLVVPDMRQAFIRGTGEAGRLLGSTQADAFASHTHGGSTDVQGVHSHGGSTGPAGAHSHTYPTVFNAGNGGNVYAGAGNFAANGNTSAVGDHTHSIGADGGHSHTITIGSAGGAAETRPYNVAGLVCVKL